ncbi:AzlC family ABC transporter permease [Streptomyces sp. NPDC052225]|uniref:AzlC family ABC transporter permease n=1 Tax=Streptomyces sp. NPDC052225 TaxID=3154949 RepID=UPI0034167850
MRNPLRYAGVAVRDAGPVGLGALPMGMAFGVLVAHSGLAWWWASVISGLVYAGSLEFLLLGLVLAVAPLTAVASTAFLVNVRHVFYALSFPLHRIRGAAGKAYGTFALSDEAWAVTTRAGAASWPGGRILGAQAVIHAYWAGGATLGALAGSRVPDGPAGLDFAVTALFVALALDALREHPGVPTPLLALGCALLARLLCPGQLLLAAFGLFTAGLVVRHRWTGRTGGASRA